MGIAPLTAFFEQAFWETFVALFFAVTVAPDATAPFASGAWPVKPAVLICATTGAIRVINRANRIAKYRIYAIAIDLPITPPGLYG